jgi:hypothetical protein
MAESYERPQEGVSKTREKTSNRKYAKVAGAGLYRHPDSGQEAIVLDDPLWGNTQAQAFTRMGYEFVREAKEGEIKTLPELQRENRDATSSDVKGLMARVDALEGVKGENEDLKKELAALRAEKESREKADAEKAEADAKQADEDKKHVEAAGKANSTTAADESAEGAKANAQEQTDAREETKKKEGK